MEAAMGKMIIKLIEKALENPEQTRLAVANWGLVAGLIIFVGIILTKYFLL